MADRRLAALALAAGVAAILAGSAQEAGAPAITAPRPYALAKWSADTDNVAIATGRVTAGGAPVAGVRLRVDRWRVPRPTGRDGLFSYPVDVTRLARHVVTVVDPGAAGAALAGATAAITVAYPLHDVRAGRDGRGRPTVSGRISYSDGTPPPAVALYSYELEGTVTDANGRPVVGARVSTRTIDRDFWTVSGATDAHGRYHSVFIASSELGGNPVPFSVRVAKGDLVYEFLPEEYVLFQRLESAQMDVRLPPPNFPLALPQPRSYPGGVYEGIVVGAAAHGRPVRPVAVSWPDSHGRFRLTLPRALAGRTVTLWEARLDLFSSAPARAGGVIDLRDWPRTLAPDVPQGLASVTLRH